MIIAQAIASYGVISSLVASATRTFDSLVDSLLWVDSSTWILVASGVFILWLIVGRPR